MSGAVLALVFLALVPVNIWAVSEVVSWAMSRPKIDLLVLLAWLVLVLCIAASVFAVFSAFSLYRVLDDGAALPQPWGAVIFVTSALLTSSANIATAFYARTRKRAEQ